MSSINCIWLNFSPEKNITNVNDSIFCNCSSLDFHVKKNHQSRQHFLYWKMVTYYVSSILWPCAISAFWIIFAFLPCFIQTSKRDRGVCYLFCIMTAVTCWLFWFCCFIFQYHPLIGPKLHANIALIMAREWNHEATKFNINETINP